MQNWTFSSSVSHMCLCTVSIDLIESKFSYCVVTSAEAVAAIEDWAEISFTSCPTSHCQSGSNSRRFITSADGKGSKNSLIFRSQMDFKV